MDCTNWPSSLCLSWNKPPVSPTEHAPIDGLGYIPEDYLYITCLELKQRFLWETVLYVVAMFLGQSSKVYI